MHCQNPQISAVTGRGNRKQHQPGLALVAALAGDALSHPVCSPARRCPFHRRHKHLRGDHDHALFILRPLSRVTVGKVKRVFRVIEHSAIFLPIAGTYTPFTLGVLRGTWDWTLLGVVWGLAAVGVALKFSNKGGHPILSTSVYLTMGWLIVIAVKPMVASVPAVGLLWLLAAVSPTHLGWSFSRSIHGLGTAT